ncbi:carboxypeptidase-like regulatory domain-containing protein [Engelhardtia mirabilis]|uniref:Nickel uptake substrate-specific transmembrane region n=1 Tax=Engelhardtia mirabilis TaxID=2528011 RepID=A0A518BFA0_9BACT|nr:hypothetical protein Pla133_07220 [Planctomycetes bacterium Pla133]QDU99982.1 hypothetical protein Pla86_07210 [Planctomycetes bacterium Pla86]
MGERRSNGRERGRRTVLARALGLAAVALVVFWSGHWAAPGGGQDAGATTAGLPSVERGGSTRLDRASAVPVVAEPAAPFSTGAAPRRVAVQAALLVRVVDSDGLPVEAAVVELGASGPLASTDRSGEAGFDAKDLVRAPRDARDGLPLVTARMEGYGEAVTHLATGMRTLELVLEAPWQAQLDVRTEAGDPVEAASIRWRGVHFDSGKSPWSRPTVTATAAGTFLIEPLNGQLGQVLVESTDFGSALAMVAAARRSDSDAPRPCRVVLAGPLTIDVRVVDDLGRPVEGARVWQWIAGISDAEDSAGLERITDAAGRARIPQARGPVPTGISRLHADCAGHRPTQVYLSEDATEQGPVTITLERAARLSVHMVDERGRGVPGIAFLQRLETQGLRMRLSGGAVGDVIELDAEGRGVFERAPTYQPIGLRVGTAFASQQYGHIPWAQELRALEPGEEREQTVVLAGHTRLELSLSDGRGEFLAGQLLLTLLSAEGEPAGRYDSWRVDVSDLEPTPVWLLPGRYEVSIWPRGWGQSFRRELEVEGADQQQAFVVESAGELTGRLVDPEGRPHQGQRISASIGAQIVATVASDESGRFRVRGLEGGIQYLTTLGCRWTLVRSGAEVVQARGPGFDNGPGFHPDPDAIPGGVTGDIGEVVGSRD